MHTHQFSLNLWTLTIRRCIPNRPSLFKGPSQSYLSSFLKVIQSLAVLSLITNIVFADIADFDHTVQLVSLSYEASLLGKLTFDTRRVVAWSARVFSLSLLHIFTFRIPICLIPALFKRTAYEIHYLPNNPLWLSWAGIPSWFSGVGLWESA